MLAFPIRGPIQALLARKRTIDMQVGETTHTESYDHWLVDAVAVLLLAEINRQPAPLTGDGISEGESAEGNAEVLIMRGEQHG